MVMLTEDDDDDAVAHLKWPKEKYRINSFDCFTSFTFAFSNADGRTFPSFRVRFVLLSLQPEIIPIRIHSYSIHSSHTSSNSCGGAHSHRIQFLRPFDHNADVFICPFNPSVCAWCLVYRLNRGTYAMVDAPV